MGRDQICLTLCLGRVEGSEEGWGEGVEFAVFLTEGVCRKWGQERGGGKQQNVSPVNIFCIHLALCLETGERVASSGERRVVKQKRNLHDSTEL